MSRRDLLAGLSGLLASLLSSPAVRAASKDRQALPKPLEGARLWLDASNKANMRAFALGEERRFLVDQNRQQLSLVHGDRATVKLPIQIIGSFNPHTGDFLWAWANESVDDGLKRAALAAKDLSEREKISELAQAKLNLGFDALIPYIALAAQSSGAIGLYRCIDENSLSVFVAIMAFDASALPKGFWKQGLSTAELETKAVSMLDRWDAENLPIDREFYALDQINALTEEQSDELLARKLAIYKRYWVRDDSDWEPGSFGWPSDHDPAEQFGRFAVPRRMGGVYVITHERHVDGAHVVEMKNGALAITDHDIDWATGVVFAR